MTRTAIALLVSIAMLGCFPHNERHRTYAKWAEGGALISGIVISSLAQTGADCDKMEMAGVDSNCRTKAKILGGLGMTLILGGLVGFIATVSTAEDDDLKKARAAQDIKVDTEAKTEPKKPEPKAEQAAAPASEPAPAPTPAP